MAGRKKKNPWQTVLHHRRKLRRGGGRGDLGSASSTQSCTPAASPPRVPFPGWAPGTLTRTPVPRRCRRGAPSRRGGCANGCGIEIGGPPDAAGEADTRTRTQPSGLQRTALTGTGRPQPPRHPARRRLLHHHFLRSLPPTGRSAAGD